MLLELFCDRGPQIISTRATCVASPALWHFRKTRTLSGKTENKSQKFGRDIWLGLRAIMEHQTFRIRCTLHRNVAACQLHNHMLSTAVPYVCFCLVPTHHISKCTPLPAIPLRSYSNGPLPTLSRSGQREDYEIVLARNPPNQHKELMELDAAKNLSAHWGLS